MTEVIETVLRIADDRTVPIALRRSESNPCEWEPVSIDGVAPWYWLASMEIGFTGTPRETKEQRRVRYEKNAYKVR